MKAIMGVLLIVAASAHAKQVEIGHVDLNATFTVSHLYNFNDPVAHPFGQFATLVLVDKASGLFAPYVSPGDRLSMASPFVFGPMSTVNWDVSQPMNWSLDGFTIETLHILIVGPDFATLVTGITDLQGNGFDPTVYPNGAHSSWSFIAPPFDVRDFNEDVSGPVTLSLSVGYRTVPDAGETALLLAIGLLAIVFAALRAKE